MLPSVLKADTRKGSWLQICRTYGWFCRTCDGMGSQADPSWVLHWSHHPSSPASLPSLRNIPLLSTGSQVSQGRYCENGCLVRIVCYNPTLICAFLEHLYFKACHLIQETFQFVKVFADKFGDINPLPRTAMVQIKNWLLQVYLHAHTTDKFFL